MEETNRPSQQITERASVRSLRRSPRGSSEVEGNQLYSQSQTVRQPGDEIPQQILLPDTGHDVSQSKHRHRFYKPLSTTSPILSLFFLSSLVFIAGIEVIVRFGIPFTVQTSSTGGSSPNATITSHIAKAAFQPNQQSETQSSCIGIEMIVSQTGDESCNTALSDSCVTTYSKPIYNVPIPTMPCYVCAMKDQGIPINGWITASTTHCHSCTSTKPATIYPCSTCEGTILTSAPKWESTPTAPLRPYSTYPHNEHDH